jgi:probable nitrogen fixation protein
MDTETISHPIIQNLLRLIRAEDRSGAYDAEPDEELLAPFVVTKVQKRELPMFGDPDPDILARVETFYGAVAIELERRTGRAVVPMMNIHHEGWGRVLLIAGRLVAVKAHVRELHRFGFGTLAQLVEKAEKLVVEGAASIEAFPAVADA